MLITLGIFFFYCKLQLCFVLHALIPHLHVVKEFLNLKFIKNALNFLIKKIACLLNYESFLNVGNRLLS